MAYNSSYNPDALPAHAEPEQAAALLSSHQPAPQNPRPPRRSSAGQQYQRRQSPNQAQYDQYNRPHSPPSHEQDYPPSRQSQAGYGRGAAAGQARGYGYPQGYGGPQNYGGPHARGSPNTYNQSPPPQNYGFSQPPQQYHNRPSPVSRPPPTPAPGAPPGGDSTLFRLFKAVDKDGSGQLSERELRAALVNGDWTSFDPYTVKMMIRMFDTDRSGTIGFDEFCNLWAFLASWRSLFDRFDEDRSGNISYDEYSKALLAFGYRLSPQFVQLLFRTYDKRGENAISFDLFVQSCISLKRMTDVFKKYDDDRDGFISLSFEEFLTEILRQR